MKNLKRVLALLLAVTLMVSLFTGCGEKAGTSGNGGTGSSDTNKNPNVNAEDYRGTTVTYVTWKDPDKNEDGIVVSNFKKKYGIDVKIDMVSQDDYVNTISASIASGTQGDICFVNGTFPGSLTIMQPLDAAKLNLEDPIWNQATLKNSTIDGHPYLVDTLSNVWAEVDVCVYNKALFEQNGITSPAEYYEAGSWTLETFKKACREITALGKGYTGATVLGEIFLGLCGANTYSFENGVFKANINDRYYDATIKLSELFNDGLITPTRSEFSSGKVGMALTNCYALKRTGYYSNFNSDNIGVTYLPRYDQNSEQITTGIYRGWGLIRGAKNPEAAGIFLREYLDVNNYDLDATFHNEDAANFFFKVTGEAQNINYYYTEGMAVASGHSEREIKYFEQWSFRSTPSQVRGYIDSKLPTIERIVEQANAVVQSENKWLKENFS